jgi:hypothetical protein
LDQCKLQLEKQAVPSIVSFSSHLRFELSLPEKVPSSSGEQTSGLSHAFTGL